MNRWRRAALTLVLICLVLIGYRRGSQLEQEISACDAAKGHADAEFTRFFRRSGEGWTGGDGTYSVLLPDGRTVWIFGDSFLGEVNSDGSRPPMPLVRNALLIQDGDELTTLYGADPRTFFVPQNPQEWYWTGDATVFDDRLYVFLTPQVQEGTGMWSFQYAAHNDVAILSLPELELERIVTLNHDPVVVWGVAVLEEAEYTYIYGVEDMGTGKYAHIARVRGGDILGAWEYYDGAGWRSEGGMSARILEGVSNQFSVIKLEDQFYLISQMGAYFGREIYSYEADSPAGVWEHQRLLYCTPESSGNLFTYNAVAHPQFIQNGELLISYNVNSFEIEDVFTDADNYRPRFIRVALD